MPVRIAIFGAGFCANEGSWSALLRLAAIARSKSSSGVSGISLRVMQKSHQSTWLAIQPSEERGHITYEREAIGCDHRRTGAASLVLSG
jgi:hypothetical protein